MKKLTKEQELVIESLLRESKTTKEIIEITGLCRETIRRRARVLGIKAYTGKSPVYNIIDCQNDLRQLVIGSLLGDGSFVKVGTNSTGCCLSIAHCIEQKDYLEYKFSILNKYKLVNNIRNNTHTDNRFKNPQYEECRFRTRLNPLFTYIRNKCYIDGKKHINMDIIEHIDTLGLAIWYMDDGYVTNNSCIFSTCSFSIEEQEKLSMFLLGKFGLHFSVGRNDNSMYLLYKDFQKFKELITPFIIPSLKYKLIPYKYRVLHKSDELLEGCDANQQPSQSLTTLEGSETNS